MLPVFLLLNKRMIHNLKYTAAYFLSTLQPSSVWNLVMIPNITYIQIHLHANLIPFADRILLFLQVRNFCSGAKGPGSNHRIKLNDYPLLSSGSPNNASLPKDRMQYTLSNLFRNLL